tara:strand:+ start:389 stop:622 length:234 start_codon:yes stop_codon:yes gene_type:complete
VKPGDLVKYIGAAAMYRDRVGVVASLYGFNLVNEIDSARVYFSGLEGKGRASAGLGQIEGPLHPMALDELEIVSESR